MTVDAARLAGRIATGSPEQPVTLRGMDLRGCAARRIRAGIEGSLDDGGALGRELEGLGHPPSRDDADVLAHAWEAWGDRMVERLRGSFALALWDEAERRLLLARDQLGSRALFHRDAPGALTFGTRLADVMELGDVARTVDPAAIDAYLALRTVPAPLSIYRGVAKLPAAHRLSLERGEVRLERYWTFDAGHAAWPGDEPALAELGALLGQVVESLSPSAGVLLSGGPDSAMLLAAAKERRLRLPAYSFAFRGGHGELDAARRTAEHFGAIHHALELEPQVTDVLPAMCRRHEEPHGNPSALFWHHVRQRTTGEVERLLCGEGADELYGGRDVHLVAGLAETAHALLPSALLAAGAAASARAGRGGAEKLLRGASLPSRRRDAYWVSTFPADARRAIYAPSFAAVIPRDATGDLEARAAAAGPHPLERTFAVEVGCLIPEVLLATTRGGEGPDVRMPFLDPRVVALAASQPPSRRVGWTTSKRLLRRLYAARLPAFLHESRRKGGMKIPVGRPLRGELAPLLRETLGSSTARSRGYFEARAIDRLLEEHLSGARDHGGQLWPLLMLELWHRQEGLR